MVFERDIPRLSPRDILIQYLRRAMREILEQVSNGVDNDGISFRLEQIIEVFLRSTSTSVFQDGGQPRGAHASGVSYCLVQNINVNLPQKFSCVVSAASIGELRLFERF